MFCIFFILIPFGVAMIQFSQSCLFLILRRRHPRHPFKEFGEKRRVGEVQFIRNLEHQQVAMLEQYFSFEDDGLVYPLHHGLSAGFAYNRTQVVGRQA